MTGQVVPKSPEHLSEFRKKMTGMDKDKILCMGYSVAAGIVIGIIIGWYIWHGSVPAAGTCPLP
jgi:hypothetical protein